MIQLIPSPCRPRFELLFKETKRKLLIASPYIKLSEADWVREIINGSSKQLTIRILTDFRTDSILSRSLDIAALSAFLDYFPGSSVFSIPRLHAKVYVSDAAKAIITSANLTTAGFDDNLEYGVEVRSKKVVSQIVSDLESYARIGSPVLREVLNKLSDSAKELSEEYEKVQKSTKDSIRRKFALRLRETTIEFLRAQIGRRAPHALFADAILYLLGRGAMTTQQLQPQIQRLLPELCDDGLELIIDGQKFGKKWKHHVRNAQQHLKKAGLIHFDGKRWQRKG
jgi:hypothetical protein